MAASTSGTTSTSTWVLALSQDKPIRDEIQSAVVSPALEAMRDAFVTKAEFLGQNVLSALETADIDRTAVRSIVEGLYVDPLSPNQKDTLYQLIWKLSEKSPLDKIPMPESEDEYASEPEYEYDSDASYDASSDGEYAADSDHESVTEGAPPPIAEVDPTKAKKAHIEWGKEHLYDSPKTFFAAVKARKVFEDNKHGGKRNTFMKMLKKNSKHAPAIAKANDALNDSLYKLEVAPNETIDLVIQNHFKAIDAKRGLQEMFINVFDLSQKTQLTDAWDIALDAAY